MKLEFTLMQKKCRVTEFSVKTQCGEDWNKRSTIVRTYTYYFQHHQELDLQSYEFKMLTSGTLYSAKFFTIKCSRNVVSKFQISKLGIAPVPTSLKGTPSASAGQVSLITKFIVSSNFLADVAINWIWMVRLVPGASRLSSFMIRKLPHLSGGFFNLCA